MNSLVSLFTGFSDNWLQSMPGTHLPKIVLFLIAAIFGLMGLALLFVGIRRSKNTKAWSRTEGKLCDYQRKLGKGASGRYRQSYAPVYEFFVLDKRYTIISNVWGSSKNGLGKTKTIFYNPGNPTDCALPQFFLGEIGGGILFLLISIAAIWIASFSNAL